MGSKERFFRFDRHSPSKYLTPVGLFTFLLINVVPLILFPAWASGADECQDLFLVSAANRSDSAPMLQKA